MPLTTNNGTSPKKEQALSDWRFFSGIENEVEKRNVSGGWIQPPTAVI